MYVCTLFLVFMYVCTLFLVVGWPDFLVASCMLCKNSINTLTTTWMKTRNVQLAEMSSIQHINPAYTQLLLQASKQCCMSCMSMWFGAKQALWPLSKNPPKVARLWIKSDAAWREEIFVDLELKKKDLVTLIDSHKHIHWPNTILMCSLGAVHILSQSWETIADKGGMGGKPNADNCWQGGVWVWKIFNKGILCEQKYR